MRATVEAALQALNTAESVLMVAAITIALGACLRPWVWRRGPAAAPIRLVLSLLMAKRLILAILFVATGVALAWQALWLRYPQSAGGSESFFPAWTFLVVYGAVRLLFKRAELEGKVREAEARIAQLQVDKAAREQRDASVAAVPDWLELAFAEFQRTRVLIPDLPWQPRPAWAGDLPFRDGGNGWHFIYMTNRWQRYSLLSEAPIQVKDLHACIPEGYTQLWVLRKVAFFAGRSRHEIRRGCVLEVPEGRRVLVGEHIVFQSPFAKVSLHDVVYVGPREDCMAVAERAASEHGDGFLVAELLVDEFWH